MHEDNPDPGRDQGQSARSPLEKAIDAIVENIDLATIQDERARHCIVQLLNLVEKLAGELRKAQAEVEFLRQQRGSGKAGGGKPNQPAGAESSHAPRSSEQRRSETKEWKKSSKLDRVSIDREEKLTLNRTILPPDAVSKGYEAVVVQELRISTDNVRFLKEKYYSPSQNQTYLAELPEGYQGEYGPNVKSLCLLFSHLGNMTEPKIQEWFANMGIVISAGQISKFVTQGQEGWRKEKEEIVEAGLASSPWQHLDDTGTRVDGENWHCHVLCNPLYTAYSTQPRKDRMTVIDVLRNQRPRISRINDEALSLLRQWKLPERVLQAVGNLARAEDWSEPELAQCLRQIPALSESRRSRILEAAAIAAYHSEVGYPVVRLLVCDDAKQFKRVTEELALCWIHDGRHYENLQPCVSMHRQQWDSFLDRYWAFYRQLLAYRGQPGPEEAARLSGEFDQLFATVTGYEALDERITKTRSNKAHLLMVLVHPEIPLHNNSAELAARLRVRKRVVSYGPRSKEGAQAWDTLETLLGTAKKLAVNFFQYIRDRVSGRNQMPSLAELIRQRTPSLNLGASWAGS